MTLVLRLVQMLAAALAIIPEGDDDLEAVIGRMLDEIEGALAGARQYAAAVLAAGRSIYRELGMSRAAADRCGQKAREAAAGGNQDLARRAACRKRAHDDALHRLEAQLVAAAQVGEKVKRCVRALESALADARRTQRLILASHRSGLARRKLHRMARPGETEEDSVVARSRGLELELEGLRQEVMRLAGDTEFLAGSIMGIDQPAQDELP